MFPCHRRRPQRADVLGGDRAGALSDVCVVFTGSRKLCLINISFQPAWAPTALGEIPDAEPRIEGPSG